MFHELYPKIINSYGTVSGRTIHRRLVKLRLEGKVLKVIDSSCEVYGNRIYYRLSKTR